MRRVVLKLLWIAIALVLQQALLTAAPDSSGFKRLTTEDLKKLVDSGEKYFLLDVREPKELEEMGSLKGYFNIPLGELESRLGEIPKDARVITACQRGVRAAKAAELLEKHGYKVVGACGLKDWKEKGNPVVYPKPTGK